MVRETTREASIAIATVRENGRSSSPAHPETTATGRNTITVASVAEVMAPATSPTASTIARMRVLP